jgi:hypothetical protein
MIMISNKVRTFKFSCSDDRTVEFKKLVEKIEAKLHIEHKRLNADILIISCNTGAMLNKKLFKLVESYQLTNKKCYIYSEYSDSFREILRIEKSIKFDNSSIFGVIIHSGMNLQSYKQTFNLIEQ